MSNFDSSQITSPFKHSTGSDRLFGWLQHRSHQVLFVAVAFQLLVLSGMIFQRATPLVTGDTILLKVVPVDPRDLFRGDYVILSYDFSRTPRSSIAGLPPTRGDRREWENRTVYVSLVPEPDGLHWRTDQVSTKRPQTGKYLVGQISGHNRVECGIESFYVQEGTGRKYEQAIRSRKLSAEIAVTSDGQATLRDLRIE